MYSRLLSWLLVVPRLWWHNSNLRVVSPAVCKSVSKSQLFVRTPVLLELRSPGGAVGKESACNARAPGEAGSIPGSGRAPGAGHGNPLQYSCLENPCGQRSLAGYSPWGLKELDTTERLSTA